MKYVLLLALSQVADVVTTGLAMAHGSYETNPTALWIIQRGGLFALLLVKLFVIVLAAYIAVRVARKDIKTQRFAYVVIVGIAFAYFMVASWNLGMAVG